MGLFEIFSRLSILAALLAYVFLHSSMESHRQQLYKLLSTCPMRWFDGTTELSDDKDSLIRNSGTLMTKEELAKYGNQEGSLGLYLAIAGLVFDVSKGAKHYGTKGGYEFFAGRDGTRAFVTGEFNEKGLIEDVSGLTGEQMMEVLSWIKFYDTSYTYKGRLIGWFYDAEGRPTQHLLEAQKMVEAGVKDKEAEEKRRLIFPPCNTQWSEGAGSTLWCSTKSGGIERGWVGVPRKLFHPTRQTQMCVCVRNTGPPSDVPETSGISSASTNRGDLDHPHLKEYEGCAPDSYSCSLKN